MRILVVEDDDLIAQGLIKILANETYAVEVAKDGELAWELIETYEYDLVLLDVVLPKLDGIKLCKKLRSHHHQMPVLLLTGRDSGHDKAVGLDAGADDYVVKPFDPEELAARIRALLRRGSTVAQPVLTWGDLRLDPTTHEVSWRSQPLSLTAKEYALLELFLRNSRRVFSCGMILEHLWSYETMPGDEAVRTHIKCLRQKFKTVGIPTDLIETVYGIGYRLKESGEGAVGAGRENSAHASAVSQSPPNSQPPTPNPQQTQQAIAQVWERFKGRVSDQIAVLEQAATATATAATTDTMVPDLWQEAQQNAHTLAGALGTFGFPNGSHLARQIEHLLKTGASLSQGDREHLSQLVVLLRQEIGQPPHQKSGAVIVDKRPLLLVIDCDRTRLDDMTTEAGLWGFRLQWVADLTTARTTIYRDRPDVVLLDWTSFRPANPNQSNNQAKDCASLLTELSQQQPPISTLVCTDRDELTERLELSRLGGHILSKPLSVAQLLEVASQTLHQANAANATVLAVDDDPKLLAILKNLLEPWGLNVAVLDNPQRFWQTLETTAPDLLILDVEMPHLSGIELCQIVRHDARWSGLPILFLTAHTDANIVNQVFAMGADDFVCKPIVGPELVTRIVNRLDRIRLLHQVSEVDIVTGLANRQRAIPQINLLLSLANRYRQPLCLATFKVGSGLSTGDRQFAYKIPQDELRQMGQLLQQSFRTDDVVAYWGDNEFIVALYGTSRSDGAHQLQDILNILNQQSMKVGEDNKSSISWSVGLATYPEDGHDLQTLHRVASAALRSTLMARSDRPSPLRT